ncbi:MAG: thioredoxin domain-containing protein [Chthonomonas sp.]|nr:thioredoxin domain-containing protein [Chthonomonas sp.]
MPRRREKRYYSAVTWSVILVGMMALAGSTLRRFIPRPPLNDLEHEADPFLKAAASQPISWRLLSKEALAEARREGKPILLVIGQSTSLTGQILDGFGFTDSEIADNIRRSFIPIRVDAVSQPYLAAAYDPVRRSRDGWDPTLQIWYLSPDGNQYGSLLSQSTDPSTVFRSLASSIAYNSDYRARTRDTTAGESQRLQVAALLQAGLATPAIESHLEALRQVQEPLSGGWPGRFGTRVQALPLAFLMKHSPRDAESALEKLATSGMVDWINGGFFSLARQPEWRNPDFEKSALVNAALVEVYVQAGQNPLYREIGCLAFDSLVSDFCEDGFVRTHRFGDGKANRSAKSSFSPRFLLDHFDEAKRDRATKLFRLDSRQWPAALPKVASSQFYRENQAELLSLLEDLRRSKQDVDERFSSQITASVHGYVTARLLASARILGGEYTQKANELFSKLAAFRTGENDVLRRRSFDSEPACLADYLAYADAALESALLNNNPDHAKDGLAVLNRALDFFSLGPGVLSYASPESSRDLPPETVIPQIIDNELESTTALAIRLAKQYSWYFEVVHRSDQTGLRTFARTAVSHFASMANEIQIGLSGYFRAASMVRDDRFIVVRGRGSADLSRQVQQRLPCEFVIALPNQGDAEIDVMIGGKKVQFPSVDSVAAAFGIKE